MKCRESVISSGVELNIKHLCGYLITLRDKLVHSLDCSRRRRKNVVKGRCSANSVEESWIISEIWWLVMPQEYKLKVQKKLQLGFFYELCVRQLSIAKVSCHRWLDEIASKIEFTVWIFNRSKKFPCSAVRNFVFHFFFHRRQRSDDTWSEERRKKCLCGRAPVEKFRLNDFMKNLKE